MFPGLNGFEPAQVADGIEAISLLVYRETRRALTHATFTQAGNVYMGGRLFPADTLAEELRDVGAVETGEAGVSMMRWLYEVAQQVTLLFPHLQAFRHRDGGALILCGLSANKRIKDPAERWRRGDKQ